MEKYRSRKIMYDSHVHSRCSPDGRDPVEALCRVAVARGLKGIAITDHCDIYHGRSACEEVVENLGAEVRQARELFGGQLTISMGLELGEAHNIPELAREISSRPEVDFVIGSLHKLRDEKDFYFMGYDRFSPASLASLLDRYYDELIEIAELDCLDVMAHIGYQGRYMSSRVRRVVSEMDFSGKLRRLFSVLVQNGKGLEVNSTTMRMGEGGFFPTPEVLQMFRQAGGEVVTTGSDSHLAATVGEGIPMAMERIKEAGFERAMFFQKRKPLTYEL